MRNTLLDGRPDEGEIVWQISGLEVGSDGHHAAANVDTDRRRNDRSAGGNDATDRGSLTEVNVWHDREVRPNYGKLGDVLELKLRLLLNRNTVDPRLDWYAL